MSRAPSLRWILLLLGVALVAFSLIAPHVVVASDNAWCENPHDAADSIFVAPDPALACVDTPEADRARLGTQLRQILDARGLYVPVASLPKTSDVSEEVAEGGRIQLLEVQAPWLVLEQQEDGSWLYSRATMNQVPTLYEQTFSSLSLKVQELLPGPFQREVPVIGGYGWQWLLGAGLVLVAFLAGLLVRLVILAQLQRITGRLTKNVDKRVFDRLNLPVMVFVFAGIVTWRLSDLQLGIDLSRTAYVLLSVVLGLAGVVIASRLVDVATGVWQGRTAETESRLDDQLVPLVRQMGKLVVWAIGLLFVLQNNGVQVWSFVAGLGIGSLAFALAAQDTVANLFGAMNIFLDKPFQVGDWVKVDSIEGTVEEVGFRSFRIRTFYNSLVTIPNSVITNSPVDNLGARHRRRVKITLGLTYDTPPDKVQAFVEGVRAVLATHPKVEATYEVHFHTFGPSSLDILVYYHVVVDTWTEELETRSQNFLEFMRVADTLGVSFAFPSTSVYVQSTPEQPLQPHAAASVEELEAKVAAFAPGGALARPGGVPFQRSWSTTARTGRGE